MTQLFGTDGIRGEVGKYPLTASAVCTLGRALGIWLKRQYPQVDGPIKVLIGRDTRGSGSEIEVPLTKGLRGEGIEVLRAGVCPTPCVSFLTRALGAHLGAAISASHNPGSDNGIKLFDADGYKFFSFIEKRIEEIFSGLEDTGDGPEFKTEDLKEEADCLVRYSNFVKDCLSGMDLSGLTLVVDCAHGSFSKVAPEIMRRLKAKVIAINDRPDGMNINVDCGTLHPQTMAQTCLEHKADIGIAFDGDGDRVILADETGKILDGDDILAILAKEFLEQKRLTSNTVICTTMSNLGLELYLKSQGIRAIRTRVGDKYVLEEMLKNKVNLGGEQSGHIIILERTATGDGLIAVLELIKLMLKNNRRLSSLCTGFRKFPQVLKNVPVREKRPFEEVPGFNKLLEDCRKELGESARILVRYSGTENLARVMVEGPQASMVNQAADRLAGLIAGVQQ